MPSAGPSFLERLKDLAKAAFADPAALGRFQRLLEDAVAFRRFGADEEASFEHAFDVRGLGAAYEQWRNGTLTAGPLLKLLGTPTARPSPLPPAHLYKYRSLATRQSRVIARALVRDRTVYMTPPGTFKDKTETLPELPAFGAPVLGSRPLENVLRGQGPDFHAFMGTWSQNFVNLSYGVYSLTDSARSGDMWTEYSHHHRGICVEFDAHVLLLFTLQNPEQFHLRNLTIRRSRTMRHHSAR